MLTISAYGVEYDIMGDNFKAVERNGLNAQSIRNRIVRGWSLHEACHVPKRMSVDEYRIIQHTMNHVEDTSEATMDYRDEKLRNEKPHLFDGTPQKHSRGEWCKYLMNTSIFPKVVR
ncbi:SA1788 family PVL leukocidin-associated protein [Staphylococcus pseudoxylosus]|uniref:SA1788 family PVL leukocidin-associated protein n=1 Tax=Staphylococcus pseudoxylosus TaxID=2282419 RepID=UPI00398BACD6